MNNEIDLGVVLILIGVFLLIRKIWQLIQIRKKAPVIIPTNRIPLGFDPDTGKAIYSSPVSWNCEEGGRWEVEEIEE